MGRARSIILGVPTKSGLSAISCPDPSDSRDTASCLPASVSFETEVETVRTSQGLLIRLKAKRSACSGHSLSNRNGLVLPERCVACYALFRSARNGKVCPQPLPPQVGQRFRVFSHRPAPLLRLPWGLLLGHHFGPRLPSWPRWTSCHLLSGVPTKSGLSAISCPDPSDSRDTASCLPASVSFETEVETVRTSQGLLIRLKAKRSACSGHSLSNRNGLVLPEHLFIYVCMYVCMYMCMYV